MTEFHLKDYIGGWIVGDFDPCIIPDKNFEFAIKEYPAGFKEPKHVHKIAKEITVIVTGKAKMNGKEYSKGEIIVLEPGEPGEFETLEPTITAVIKTPSAPNDKYILDGEND